VCQQEPRKSCSFRSPLSARKKFTREFTQSDAVIGSFSRVKACSADVLPESGAACRIIPEASNQSLASPLPLLYVPKRSNSLLQHGWHGQLFDCSSARLWNVLD
jgi:hypothetical protein